MSVSILTTNRFTGLLPSAMLESDYPSMMLKPYIIRIYNTDRKVYTDVIVLAQSKADAHALLMRASLEHYDAGGGWLVPDGVSLECRSPAAWGRHDAAARRETVAKQPTS